MDANGNNLIVVTYLLYLLISVAITIWVARTLYKSGGVFLVDAFHGNEPLADSINHLLLVGFYLINIGYVALALRYGAQAASLQELVENVSTKVGAVLLILGGMHFFNILVFAKMRNRATSGVTAPPRSTVQGSIVQA